MRKKVLTEEKLSSADLCTPGRANKIIPFLGCVQNSYKNENHTFCNLSCQAKYLTLLIHRGTCVGE
jgi:hypothetical protein